MSLLPNRHNRAAASPALNSCAATPRLRWRHLRRRQFAVVFEATMGHSRSLP